MVKQTSDETRNSDDHCMRRCSLQHHSVASECNYITAPSETLLDTNVIQSSIDNVIRSFEGNSTTTTHTLSPSHHVEDILLNHSGYVLSTCSDEDSHNGRLTTYTPAQPTISSSDVQSHDVERILRHDSVTMALGIDLQKNGVPSCKGHKMKREWRNVGWFTNAEAMNEVRKREKVSKRKSVVQVNGTKVFYRCNRWRRTNCNYRMFAMYYAPNRISLNESGYHDHSTPNRDFKTSSRNSGAVFEATASSSQQHVLDQLVLNATVNSSHLFNSFEQENVFEPVCLHMILILLNLLWKCSVLT
ncbi:hypothetical protein AB6A40_009699 [Gnathostoma spinigerum]|uniref:FLYWCH-type domain-containing protein n=1 Tax=Gnathostoma spinigerum TaxID=75299 RepID=A0ABD6ETZ0_9BILA